MVSLSLKYHSDRDNWPPPFIPIFPVESTSSKTVNKFLQRLRESQHVLLLRFKTRKYIYKMVNLSRNKKKPAGVSAVTSDSQRFLRNS